MATYTLSYTGAEVNSAIGNAKDLFSTVHTWTAEQTFTNLTIQTGGLTVAEINTNEATIEYLRVEGGDAAASFYGPATFFNEAIIDSSASLTVQGTATFSQNITVTGDVTAGSATINGEVDISDDLIVTNGTIIGAYQANNDVNMDGYGIDNAQFVNSQELSVHKDSSTVSIVASGAGIASASHDGFYITSNGSIVPFNATGTIPASVLVVYFR